VRRRRATASRAVVALRPLAPLSRDDDYDDDDDNDDYDGYLGTLGEDGGREAGCAAHVAQPRRAEAGKVRRVERDGREWSGVMNCSR
jgi:hypothetical protein